MKKLLFILFIFLSVSTAFAAGGEQNTALPTTFTADAAIMTSPGFFKGFIITPDGTNDVTITFYDNASAASGTKLAPTMTFAGDGGSKSFSPPAYVRCKYGVYADITIAAGSVEVTAYTATR